ncbi:MULTISPECIES: hypothetical protein [unclassified Bradyrhizobium]|uniref:hypothetical protein n=1 Tax=unclassified Bradyrhizobium TaxID=2631580 RepID=UPI001FFB0425|nr:MULTISPECIES: hypothetical protein [unclassified Bradyrhizobium]
MGKASRRRRPRFAVMEAGFGGKGAAPNLPRDERVITESDLHAYVSAYERTSFYGTT